MVIIDILIFNIKPIQLNPNPDKPELNIDDLRLKICGIASLCFFY
jgi:hypothetical protein